MFIDKTNREKVAIAVSKANRIMSGEPIYVDIASEKYTHTNDSAKVIAHYLKLTFNTYEISIKTYKPWYRWSKAIAYVSKNNPFEINLNSRKLPKRSIDDIALNLIHECCHSAGYSHGNNSPKGKQDSVPYKVASIARRYLSLR